MLKPPLLRRAIGLSFALALSVACREVTAPESLSPKPATRYEDCDIPTYDGTCSPTVNPTAEAEAAAGARAIVESPGFYMGPDGMYRWDGEPPVGDAAPVLLTDLWAMAVAPGDGFGGLAKGHFKLSGGDESKITLSVSADFEGSPVLSGTEYTSGWKMCSLGFIACKNYPVDYQHPLGLKAYPCGVTVVVGGTAEGRKSLPFGLEVEISVKKIGSLTLFKDWSPVFAGLPAHRHQGRSCADRPPPASGGGGSTPPSVGGTYTLPSIFVDIPSGGGYCELKVYYHWTVYSYPDGVPDGAVVPVLDWTYEREERTCYPI